MHRQEGQMLKKLKVTGQVAVYVKSRLHTVAQDTYKLTYAHTYINTHFCSLSLSLSLILTHSHSYLLTQPPSPSYTLPCCTGHSCEPPVYHPPPQAQTPVCPKVARPHIYAHHDPILNPRSISPSSRSWATNFEMRERNALVSLRNKTKKEDPLTENGTKRLRHLHEITPLKLQQTTRKTKQERQHAKAWHMRSHKRHKSCQANTFGLPFMNTTCTCMHTGHLHLRLFVSLSNILFSLLKDFCDIYERNKVKDDIRMK